MPEEYYSIEALGKRINERLKQPKVSPVVEQLKQLAQRRGRIPRR